MCDQCLCRPQLIGHPVHGWKLIKAHANGVFEICTGDYGLINEAEDQNVNIRIPAKAMPKHRGITWADAMDRPDNEPSEDDDFGLLLNDVTNFAEAIRQCAPIDDLADLVVAATRDGFDPDRDGYFSWWLYSQISGLKGYHRPDQT